MQKKNNHEQLDFVADRIEQMLSKIKEEENPDALNEYKKIYKSHVPIHLRSYFTAFLLKSAVGGTRTADSGSYKTLFISVGKNRKVYPRDINRLIAEALGISSPQIGTTKILDNYSFVEVPEHLAGKAISALNNTEFRGRRITVNYARKKDDKNS